MDTGQLINIAKGAVKLKEGNKNFDFSTSKIR